MSQNDFGGEFRVGITEEKHIHRSFRQNSPRSLYLHSIPYMTKNTNRRPHRHTHRFEIVDQAASPMCGPITRKLRCVPPELLIIGTMLSLCKCNLLNTILPMLVGLILRDPTRQYDI